MSDDVIFSNDFSILSVSTDYAIIPAGAQIFRLNLILNIQVQMIVECTLSVSFQSFSDSGLEQTIETVYE